MSTNDPVTTIVSSAYVVYGPYGQVYTTDSVEGQFDVLGTGYVHSTDNPPASTTSTTSTSSFSSSSSSSTTSTPSSTSIQSTTSSSSPSSSSSSSSSVYVYVPPTSTSTTSTESSTSTTSTDWSTSMSSLPSSTTTSSSWPDTSLTTSSAESSSSSTTSTTSSWYDAILTTSSTESTSSSSTSSSTESTTTSTSSEFTTSTESSTTSTTSSDASTSTTSSITSSESDTTSTTWDTTSSSTTYSSTTSSSDTYTETSSFSTSTDDASQTTTTTDIPSSTSSTPSMMATTGGANVENASQEKHSSGLTSSQSKIVVAAVTPAAFVCLSLILALCIFFWRKRRTRRRLQRQSSLDKNNNVGGNGAPFYAIPMPPVSSPSGRRNGELTTNDEKKGSTPHSLSIVPVDAENDALSLLSPDTDYSPRAALIPGLGIKGHNRGRSSISMTAKRVSGILRQQFSSDDDDMRAKAQGSYVHMQSQVSSSDSVLPFKPSGGNIIAAELAGASMMRGQREKPILTPVTEKNPASAFFADPPLPIHNVDFEYNATMSDELSIRPGQLVKIRHEFDDGWCNADLLDNQSMVMIANGIVPKACLGEHPVPSSTLRGKQQQQPSSSSTSPRMHYTPSIPQGFPKNPTMSSSQRDNNQHLPEDVGRAV